MFRWPWSSPHKRRYRGFKIEVEHSVYPKGWKARAWKHCNIVLSVRGETAEDVITKLADEIDKLHRAMGRLS